MTNVASERVCRICNQPKALNAANFRPYPKNRPPGFFTVCRQCMNERDTKRTHTRHEETPPVFDENVLKACVSCPCSWPATPEFFDRNRRKPDGLEPHCKQCKSKRTKEYREKNPDREKATKQTYRQANRETLRAKGRAYGKAHKAEKNAAWHRRQANKRQVGGSYTLQQIQEQYARQKGKCYYCRQKLTTYNIEHIVPISRGGSNDISNIVLACPFCNQSKNRRLPHEWPQGGRLL